MENLKNIFEQIKNVSTKFGSAMIVKSTPKLSGGKKCPYVGRVEKVTFIKNVRFSSYENSVNNQLERNGSESNYKAEGRKGMRFVEGMYPYILQSEKDKTQFYTSINYRSIDKTDFSTYKFLLDGKAVEDEETLTAIKNWLYVAPKKENTKQTEVGLQVEEQTKVVTYKLQNIIKIGLIKELNEVWENL
nr:MAG TPA: hypothetical protein [Ackermannviridae sp.]